MAPQRIIESRKKWSLSFYLNFPATISYLAVFDTALSYIYRCPILLLNSEKNQFFQAKEENCRAFDRQRVSTLVSLWIYNLKDNGQMICFDGDSNGSNHQRDFS